MRIILLPIAYTGGKKITKSKDIALITIKSIQEKKGINPVILEVKDVSDVADYFVICSADSRRGVKTLADHIIEMLKNHSIDILGIEGYSLKEWILIDVTDVVIHIFHQPAREFYDLEGLWIDSPRIDLPKDKTPLSSQGRSAF